MPFDLLPWRRLTLCADENVNASPRFALTGPRVARTVWRSRRASDDTSRRSSEEARVVWRGWIRRVFVSARCDGGGAKAGPAGSGNDVPEVTILFKRFNALVSTNVSCD